jgi:primosomal protein N''
MELSEKIEVLTKELNSLREQAREQDNLDAARYAFISDLLGDLHTVTKATADYIMESNDTKDQHVANELYKCLTKRIDVYKLQYDERAKRANKTSEKDNTNVGFAGWEDFSSTSNFAEWEDFSTKSTGTIILEW